MSHIVSLNKYNSRPTGSGAHVVHMVHDADASLANAVRRAEQDRLLRTRNGSMAQLYGTRW